MLVVNVGAVHDDVRRASADVYRNDQLQQYFDATAISLATAVALTIAYSFSRLGALSQTT